MITGATDLSFLRTHLFALFHSVLIYLTLPFEEKTFNVTIALQKTSEHAIWKVEMLRELGLHKYNEF